jgi:hypothetical protein
MDRAIPRTRFIAFASVRKEAPTIATVDGGVKD